MPSYDDLVQVLDEITTHIVQWQSPHDHGWCAVPSQPDQTHRSDVWTTAEMVLWLMQYDADRYLPQINFGLNYLASVQHMPSRVNAAGDGGWGWLSDSENSDATATTLALLSFVRFAKLNKHAPEVYRPYMPNMLKARDWLISHRNPDDGWSLLPEQHSTAFNTCWACIALTECLDIPGLGEPAITANIRPHVLTLVERSQRQTGWGEVLSQDGDAVGNAYCTYLLLSMKSMTTAHIGLGVILRSQGIDGGWDPGPAQSPVEATAWSVITLLAGLSKEDDPRTLQIQSALGYLLKLYVPGKGWPAPPDNEVQLWTTFYACLALLAYVDAVRAWEGGRGSRQKKKVFIVHGHNESLRHDVKALVEQVELEPVILIEQPHIGRTVYDQFEYYASRHGVDFALVLATPDDMDATEGKMRVRDNVTFELGWFMATLGPQRICVICDPAVTLPSDLEGILRINPRDREWRAKVLQVLQAFKRQQNMTPSTSQ